MLLRCVRAEMRKLRGSAVWLVFLLVPLISAAYGTVNYLQNLGLLREEWNSLYTQHTLFYALLFFSPMIGLYAAYLWRMEHLGHNMNTLMAAPVPRMDVFLAKGIVVSAMVLLTQLWVFVLYIVCGKAFARLPGWPDMRLLLWMLRGTLGAVPVAALELLLAMCIRSFAVPVLLALGGGVASVVAVSRELGLLWPYALILMGMNANRSEDMLAGRGAAFGVSCAAFTLAFLAMARGLLKSRDVRA